MTRQLKTKACLLAIAANLLMLAAPAVGDSLDDALASLRAVDKSGQGHAAAVKALPEVVAAPIGELPRVLAALDGVSPIAENWLRGAAEELVDRAKAKGAPLPLDELTVFARTVSRSPRGRRLAYELIAEHDPPLGKQLLAGMLHDTSLELRRDAVAAELVKAEEIVGRDQAAALVIYHRALLAARDLDQIEAAAKALKDFNQPVRLAEVLGFITSWQVIGPFDNTGSKGFATPYPPEVAGFSEEAEYQGKQQAATWRRVITDDELGKVDLNATVAEKKEVTAYARAVFVAEEAGPAEFRLSSYNATKIWLNGKLLAAHEVYHAGEQFDQYIARGELQAGENVIMVKCCQNEQTQSWAKYWRFSLRVTDHLGTPIATSKQYPKR